MAKIQLVQILSGDSDVIRRLGDYLNNKTIDMTLDQYKCVRYIIGENGEGWERYKKIMEREISLGLITREQTVKVNKLFTDYLLDQHRKIKRELFWYN